jgi:uncharacterized protein (DUF983 family)
LSPLKSGLLGRCPACGRASVFESFIVVREACPACGLRLRDFDLGDGATVLVILFAGALVTGLGFFAMFSLGWPDWLLLTVFLPLAALLCFGLLRPFKAMLLALIWHHKAGEGRLEK